MSDGWRSSDGDSHVKSKSPWADAGEQHDNEKLVNRVGWGDNVAPGALNMPPVQNGLDGQDPNQNGGNGRKPWRAGSTVAPSAANLPIDTSTPVNGRSPWAPAGTVAQNPDAGRAQYPDSSYRGPSDQQFPQPAPQGQYRAGYPDSVYRGPDQQQQQPSPWGRSNNFAQPEAPAPVQPQAPSAGGLDWKSFAQGQIQRDQQNPQTRLPGLPGMVSPGQDVPGVPSNSGLNPVSDATRNAIQNSLFVKTSIDGYLGTGAITGAGIGAAEWMMDKKLLSTIGQPQTGVMGWWQNHSPILKQQQGLANRLAEAEANHATQVAEATKISASLSESAGGLSKLLGSMDERVAAIAAGQTVDATAKELLQRQVEFIGKSANVTNPRTVAGMIGTADEVAAGKKLFVTGSTEAGQLTDFARLSAANTKAVGLERIAEQEMERSRTMLAESVDGGAGSLAGRSFGGAVKGLAWAGGTLAAGYALDNLGAKVFGYKAPEVDGFGRFAVDGIAVPALLMSNLPSRWKFGLAATTFLGAHASEFFGATGATTSMSSLLRPNIVDGVAITAAAMAPVDGRTKALLVGGAYLLGRAYNGIARVTGLDGGQPVELQNNAINSFSHDQLARTESSFDNAVEKGKLLGKENEAALEAQMADWLGKQNSMQPITHMRGTAVLASALGQFRLEEGSRFDRASHADKKDRILKGFDYDFGGEATTWLRMAAGSLVSAQNFAISHKGQTIDGQVMDDAYIQQLKNEQSKVEAQLNKVYAPHNVQGVFDVLKKQVRVNSGDVQQAVVRMQNEFQVLNSNDARFVAKSARDLALGMFAESSYMAEQKSGESARNMYLAGVQYLETAKRVDPNNPDNRAIEDIKNNVLSGSGAQPSINSAVQDQYKSNFNNPFQLKTPNYEDIQGGLKKLMGQ